jgi:YD repeat-containing protein
MATRKKKETTIEMPGTIGGAKIVFAETKVVKGSHLTVTTHPDGKTTLEWDDEALLRDVRAAILKAESVIPVDTTEKPIKRKQKVEGKT